MAKARIEILHSFKRAAEDCAEKNGVSLNRFSPLALAEKVGIMGAVDFFAERGKGADAGRAVRFLEGRPG